jgi:PEP-CTERM motif
MATRYLIAAALMASACVAHADVIPTAGAGIVNGSNVAGAVGDSSVIAGVNRGAGSDALVQALYQKVSASVGSDMKVSLKQGVDGVYVTGLSTAKAAALAGDGMSVIATPEGFKIVDNSGSGNAGAGNATAGGGASQGGGSTGGGSQSTGGATNPAPGIAPIDPIGTPGNGGLDSSAGSGGGSGIGGNTDISIGIGNGNGNGNGGNTNVGIGNGSGNQAADAVALPEPSTVALMLAGMLGVMGLGRRRAR